MSTEEDFKLAVENVGHRALRVNEANGFWDMDNYTLPHFVDFVKVGLIGTEVSEALEEIRAGNRPSEKLPGFSALEDELADVFIRLVDFTARRKLRLAEAVLAKIEKNASRGRMHGGKLF